VGVTAGLALALVLVLVLALVLVLVQVQVLVLALGAADRCHRWPAAIPHHRRRPKPRPPRTKKSKLLNAFFKPSCPTWEATAVSVAASQGVLNKNDPQGRAPRHLSRSSNTVNQALC
jgi:hypothetical protein